MDTHGLPKVAWAGLGILAVGAMVLSLGQRESAPFPASDSFAPSGSSAFAELLRRSGYQVRIDKSVRPRLDKDETAIVFYVMQPEPFMGTASLEEEEVLDPFEIRLREHLALGGDALVLPLDDDFLRSSRGSIEAQPAKVSPLAGKGGFEVSAMSDVAYPGSLASIYEDYASTSLYQTANGSPAVLGIEVSEGAAFVVDDGIIATNRFLDRADNAELLLTLVSHLTDPNGKLVFTEASFGNVEEKGLLESLGAWADAGWQQLLLLGAVVIYTLGKRLGLPEATRRRQRGSRELADAVADTMQRANAAPFALRIALERANAEIRFALKLPKDADRQKMLERLPVSLQKALAALEAASTEPDLPSWDATRRIQKVDHELDAFLGARRRRAKRRDTMTS